MKYRVSLAGEDKWTEIDANSHADAGEYWAAEVWSPSEGGVSYELDVVNADGLLKAVTVDVDYDVSYHGYATKHPAGDSL